MMGRNLQKEWANRSITAINPTMCQTFANRRRQHKVVIRNKAGDTVKTHRISESTITRELSFLQAVFQRAVNDGVLKTNPMKDIKREPYETRKRVLTLEEQPKLLAALSPKYRRWTVFMLGTGLRLEECRDINPDKDINIEERWIRVTRKSRGTKKRVQQVPLVEGAEPAITALREQLATGEWWDAIQQQFRDELAEKAKRAGIPHINRTR